MSRCRPTRPFASLRNLRIYHELTCEGSTQTALAGRLGVSQRRISSIARQVRTWVDARLPADYECEDPAVRFHCTLVLEHARLRQVFVPFLNSLFQCAEGFLESRRRDDRPAEDARELRQYERLYFKGIDILRSLAELEEIIRRGPLGEELERRRAAGRAEHREGPAEATAASLGPR